MVLEEYKLTWKSTKNSITDNFYYMTQAKSYCRALGVNVAVFRVFYVMGDYRGSGPIYQVSRIKFSQKELDMNWDMIVKHKEEMMDAVGREG